MISSVPKKAVHVKWAGKTIALGTFPIAEADEKCARAKALTRAWRSTMRPKPSREWVIHELERLNVRVVTGRSPKDDEYENNNELQISSGLGMSDNNSNILGYHHHPALGNIVDPNFVGRRGSITASLLNAADIARVNGGGGGPSAWPGGQGQQPMNGFMFNPSNMMQQTRKSSLSGSSIVSSTANEVTAKECGPSGASAASTTAPPHRPLVGGGSAAAYEAARAEHYRQLATNKEKGGDNTRERNGSIPSSTLANSAQAQGILPHSMENISNFGNSNNMIGSQGRIGGLSMLASQHYEMLKLHHMNLLNEIQETTLMMNIYQQQLQQQQQLEMQQQQQQQQQQQYQQNGEREDQNSHGSPRNHGIVSPHQEAINNLVGNQYTGELPKNAPQCKEDDRIEMIGPEHSQDNRLDKSAEKDAENSSVGNDPIMVQQHQVENKKVSREDELARIKAEIEERERMLEELSKADNEHDEVKSKKPKISQV